MKLILLRLARGIFLTWIAAMLTAREACALNADEWQHNQGLSVSQAGLASVNLPVATLDAAQANLSDLRILDPNGSEVSYLIEQPRPKPESITQPQEFQTAINADSTTTVTLRTGSQGPIAAVKLVTPARRFIKSVKVESSADGLTWSEVAVSRPIFRLPDGAENLRIDFPANTYPWIRLTIDDRRAESIPVNGAQLISAGSEEAPSEPAPVTIKSRDESPGVTRISVDMGAANVPLASLEIESSSPLFSRAVSVAEPDMQDGVVFERPLAERVIYRLDVDGRNEQRLVIPIERQFKARGLILLIHNGDSAPLAIDGVKCDRREKIALFYAAAPGRYTLLTGNRQCAAPSYDLSGLSAQLKGAAFTSAEPGPLADNPAYRAPEALGSLSLQGGAIDSTKWKYRKALPVVLAGAHQVELDQDVLAHAAEDLSDIRIVQAGRQIPFVLERTSISRAVELSASQKADPDHPSRSRWQLSLPKPGLPIETIRCVSSSPLFDRSMRLWEEVADERGEIYSRELGGARWSRTPSDPKTPLVLRLDSRPQSGTLYLETDNGDNAAMEFDQFQGAYPVTRAVFKANGRLADPVWLYYGYANVGAPSYDLSLIANDLLRAERRTIMAGPEEGGGGGAEKSSEALTGASRYIFWSALALVVMVLLWVTAKLLPKENDTAPPPPGP